MKNRNLSSPILCAALLSLVANAPLSSRGATIVLGPDGDYAAAPVVINGVAANPSTYTVVAGDTLSSIAKKFGTTSKKLKKLNGLATKSVKPGQVLLVTAMQSPKAKKTAAVVPKTKKHHAYAAAQPVQDFDIPASTFASCPVPVPSPDEETDSSAPGVANKPAPIAKLVSPAELDAASEPKHVATTTPAPPVSETTSDIPIPAKPYAKALPAYPPGTSRMANSSSGLTNRGLRSVPGPNPLITTPSSDWANRFFQEARLLGNQGIEYDEDWRPPGESHAWEMDCSNTTRYLYKVTTGIQLPRTASDQYYYLHLQGKAWDVPQTAEGWADTNFLRHNLKPGDLLFWENTYRPERQPPITHVMVYLGTNDRGQWIMAGSQSSRGGEHNRRNGGPDIYVFRPSQPCGGYTTWLGLVHHQGRFCAFGRPLEADPSKLAVAAND